MNGTTRRIFAGFTTALLLALFAGSIRTRAAENPSRESSFGGQPPHLDGAMGVAAMKKFTEIYAPPLIRPNGKGVKPEELAQLRALTARGNPLIAKLTEGLANIKASEFGSFRSPISEPLGEVMKIFTRLGRANAVATPAEAVEIEAMSCDLCKQILALNIGEGDMRSAWTLAILDRNYDGLFGMREALAKAGVLEPMAHAVAWWEAPKYLRESLDEDVATFGHLFHRIKDCQIFVALASLPDGPDKLRRIHLLQGYLSQLIEGGAIRPTGEMIFHGAFHLAYAYAMPTNLRHIANMKKAGFPVSRKAQEHLRNYGRVVARIIMEEKMAPNMWMRAGSEGSIDRLGDISQLAAMGSPDGLEPIDREMAGLYVTVAAQEASLPEAPGPSQARNKQRNAQKSAIVKRYLEAGIKPVSLAGCTPLPARPALVWRNDDWMISAAGLRPGFGGTEMYGWAAPPCNAYVCNGSVLMMRKGDPRGAVGYAPSKGWDWSLWPAATTLLKRDCEQTSNRSLAGARNESSTGGVLAHGSGDEGAGLFSMKYEGKDYQGAQLSFCKSIFISNGHVLVMTSGIASSAPYPCVTTLYQELLDQPVSLSGEPPAGSPLKAPSGIGYAVLKTPLADSPVRVFNRHQLWRLPYPGNVKPEVEFPVLLHLLGFKTINGKPIDDKNAVVLKAVKSRSGDMNAMLDDFIPGEGYFAVAYFDHGVKPAGASCAFLMSLDGVPDAASVRVCRLDADAHCAYDKTTKAWIYASFKPDTVWADCGRIKHIGRAVALLAKEDNSRLHLTLASWEDTNTEAYSVTVLGHWSVAAGPATATIEADKTVLTVPYVGDQSCQVVLQEIR